MAIRAPSYRLGDLRVAAAKFLAEHHPEGTIPVPIEWIIEERFQMDIVPVPGLHRGFQIDAYITSDLSEIRVDEDVYSSVETRYRFSLAHELAHRVLHADVLKQLRFNTVEEWRNARDRITEREYRFIEWHANAFAGLILVPPESLALQFDDAQNRLAEIGLSVDDASPVVWDTLQAWIGEAFNVSGAVIDHRGRDDGLWVSESRE